MRYLAKCILPLLTVFCIGCDRPVSWEIEQHLQSLLDHKDYSALQKELRLRANEISKGKALYLTAFTDNAFNRNAASTGPYPGRRLHLVVHLRYKSQNLQYLGFLCQKTGNEDVGCLLPGRQRRYG
jgi:hypothetical protein